MPSAFQAVILALAAWRVWHLLAEDTILDKPRRYVTRLGWGWHEDDQVPDNYRFGLTEFIECPYCLGFWVALGWTVFFAIWPDGATWTALPFALNAAVVVVNHWLSDR